MKRSMLRLLILLLLPSIAAAQRVSLSFDGIDDYVEVPNAAAVQVSGAITLEAFVQVGQWNTTVWPYQMAIISKVNASGWDNGWELFASNSSGVGNGDLTVVSSPGGVNAGGTSTSSIPRGAWVHVAAVYDLSKWMVFVNGVMVQGENATGSTNATLNPLRFGRRGGAGPYNNWFNGRIESVRISHIARYSQSFTPPVVFTNDGGTAGLWFMDEGTGTTVHDASGNGNDGTVFGATWVTETPSGSLVAYFPFNGNANDESGNGNNGTVTGAVLAPDRFGNANSAYSFDGDGDYINCGNAPMLNLTGSMTIAAWVYANNFDRDHGIVSKMNSSLVESFDLVTGNDFSQPPLNRVRLGLAGTGPFLFSQSINDGEWVFVTTVFNSSSMKKYIYLNGDLTDSSDATGAEIQTNSDNLYLGSHQPSVVSYWSWDGKLDDIRIYDCALDAEAIASLYHEGDYPMPVQLAGFAAARLPDGSATLAWSTLSETGNYGFYVQRSDGSDGNFTDLPGAFVAGHGTTIEPHHYTYTDRTGSPGLSWYRLKQVDLNGAVHFSEGIKAGSATDVVEAMGQKPDRLQLLQNFPNPFNPSTTIRYALPKAGAVSLIVLNTLGQRVATLVDEVQGAGYHDVTFDAEGLTSGVYFYRIQAGAFTETKKLSFVQ